MQLKWKAIDLASATGTVDLIPAVADKRIRVRSLYLNFGTAGAVTLLNGATAVTGAMPVAANAGLALPPDIEGHFPESGVNEAVRLTRGTASTCAGFVTYCEI